MGNSFIKKLQNFIFQEKLLDRGDGVVVGISGGSDSVGLALILKQIKAKYDLKLHLVHINYHQRGEDSDRDQKFVERFAEENKLDLTVFSYLELGGSGCKGNLEELLRDFRYQKFEEVREKLNFDKVAVAHHLDDQIETFWMNLIRGSGLTGLTGMKIRRGFLIRPFLNFSKKEIEDFLENNQQKYRLDKTNLETEFIRNKIRLKLIPFLEKNFNPKIRGGLIKLIANIKDEIELNDFLVERIYLDLIEKEKDKIVLDISKLREFPVGVQKRVFRKSILKLKGDLKNISSNNFLEFKKIIESNKGKNQRMNIGKIYLEKKGKHVIFRKM